MAVRRALAVVLAAACGTGAARAQEVRGRALAPGSTVPVAGVIVTLTDTTGFVVDRALTSESGVFRLRATRPQAYRLRALRIGFRPTDSPPFALALGQVLDRSIELNGRTVTLAAVQVAAERRCDARPDSTSSAFEVWEEARKTLDAALLTRDRRYTMEVTRFERLVGQRTGGVLSESELEARSATSRPFLSVPVARLDSVGYVQDEGEWITYHGPDEEVLLSEQFASTHCLHIAAVTPDEVRLAFDPIGERKVSDIRGILALDRATGGLRRLEFTFVNVSREVQRAEAGGRVFFRLLPSGGWIVDHWSMRFPVFERAITQQAGRMTDVRAGNLRREESLTLHAMQETGGAVMEVARGDSILWQVERPTLSGLLRDERGAAIAGATVTMPTLVRRAVTDADGRFAMTNVRRGRRPVNVATPLLDSLGLPAIVGEADTRTADEVSLTIPHRDALFHRACGLPAEDAGAVGFIRGVIRGAHGERLAGVRIVATWYQPAGTRLDPRLPGARGTLEAVSGALGEYTLCGVRPDQTIALRLTVPGTTAVAGRSALVPAESRILLLDLAVP